MEYQAISARGVGCLAFREVSVQIMTSNNSLRTVALMAVLTALLVVIGRAFGGNGGMMLMLVVGIAINFGTYWFSDRIALSMSGAKEISVEEAPELHAMVEELAGNAGLPKPRVYVMDSTTPNAFATGRNPAHAAVAVTVGITRLLNRQELSAVLAHELAHIRNRDTLIGAFAASIAGAISMIAHMLQWALIFGRGDDDESGGLGIIGMIATIIIAPIAASIIQLAISRTREYGADATGARIVGDPLALASALEKLQTANQMAPMQVNPATAHQFTVQPIASGLAGLFSTHPPIEERIRRLREMSMSPACYMGRF